MWCSMAISKSRDLNVMYCFVCVNAGPMSRSPFGAPVALWSRINRNYLPMEREFTSWTITHMIFSHEIIFGFSLFLLRKTAVLVIPCQFLYLLKHKSCSSTESWSCPQEQPGAAQMTFEQESSDHLLCARVNVMDLAYNIKVFRLCWQ